jgi:hypothetical protein
MDGNWNRPFWRSVASENDGGGSMARILLAITMLCVDAALLILVVKSPETLGSLLLCLGGFATAVIGSLYGINKAPSMVEAWKSLSALPKPPDPPATPGP